MAVAFHTVLLPDIQQGMLEEIRETYDGPLTIATDLMVWNVTKDSIPTREAVFPHRVTPPATTEAYRKAPRSGEAKMSKYIMEGVWKGFTPPLLPDGVSPSRHERPPPRDHDPQVVPARPFIIAKAEIYISGVFIMKRNSCTAAFDSGRRFSMPS
jgi:hypothetical protein